MIPLSLQALANRNVSEIIPFLMAHWLLGSFMLIISGFIIWYLYLKRTHRSRTVTYPSLSQIVFLKNIFANRRRTTVVFLEYFFGVCSFFPKEGMYGINLGIQNYLFLYNVEAVEFVLKSRTTLSKSSTYKFFWPVLRDGLATSKENKWLIRRKQLSPAYHFRIIEKSFHVFNRQAKLLVEKIDKLMEIESSIEIVYLTGLYTFNGGLETTVGSSIIVNEAQTKEYLEIAHKAVKIISRRMTSPWLFSDFIFWRTEEGKQLKKYIDFSKTFFTKIIEERKRDLQAKFNVITNPHCSESGETEKPLCLLDLLINLHLKDSSVTFENVLEEMMTAVHAAHDTTAVAIGWTLHFLGWRQDIQRKVQKEIDAVLGDDFDSLVTSENVRSLKYLLCNLKEAMRLYPPFGILGRTLQKDTVINGYKVTKGTELMIMASVLHRNPEIFPDPEQFIPDRFSEDNPKKIPPFAYIPFSAGPRTCIGQKPGTYSALTFLATVLRHYNVTSVEHRDKIQHAFEITNVPENGLLLKFSKRQFSRNCFLQS